MMTIEDVSSPASMIFKIKLYKNIYKTLDKKGCFINLDQFIGTSEEINNLYNEWWYNYINNSGIKPEETG
jgi:CRISPR/Cas system CSM-associated protein Csm4 (group 5 of RAMP superfamily)